MDHTEDLSARVVFKQIIDAEEPRTPLAHSGPRRRSRLSKTVDVQQDTSGLRRSSRLSGRDATGQTPRDILRRSLRHKIRESLSRRHQPPSGSTTYIRGKRTSDPTSILYAEDDTPRHLLKNILQEEIAKSPLVHIEPVTKKLEPSPSNSSVDTVHPSFELSELDLPDVTVANGASTARGLSRKRPRHSLNVTAYENRLKERDAVLPRTEEMESSNDHPLSSTLSSSTMLSLKTPFVDARTERRGLLRKAPHYRMISEDDFAAAVYKRQIESQAGPSAAQVMEQADNEMAESEGFSLRLSVLAEPDLTTDVIDCTTALYTQPDGLPSNVAAQEKPTVMAVHLERHAVGAEEKDLVEIGQPQEILKMSGITPIKEVCESVSDTDDSPPIKPQPEQEEDAAAEAAVAASRSEEEYENEAANSQSEAEEQAAMPQSGEEEFEEESETAQDYPDKSGQGAEHISRRSQQSGAGLTENEAADSQSEGEEDAAMPQSGEDEFEEESEAAQDNQDKSGQGAEHISRRSQQSGAGLTENEAADSQSDGEEDVAVPQSGEDEFEEESEAAQDNQDKSGQGAEHISRRSQRSGAGLIAVARGDRDSSVHTSTKETGDDVTARTHTVNDLSDRENNTVGAAEHCSGQQLDFDSPDLAEPSTHGDLNPDGEEENSAGHSGEAGQEEEWEDENDNAEMDDMKTPAFVRQKRNFFGPYAQGGPNTPLSRTPTLPPAKPKPARQTNTKRQNRETALPKSFLMGTFKHFAKTRVSADVYPVLQEIMDKFFTRMAEDLEAYALHAKRKTIEVEDVELLLRRQGHVNDRVPVEVLIEKYLRLDQRKLLIPIATSGNVVFPQRK